MTEIGSARYFLVIASLVGWFLTIKQSNQDNDAGFVCVSGSLLGHWLQLHEECPEDFSMFDGSLTLVCLLDLLVVSHNSHPQVERGVSGGGFLCNSTGRLQRRGSLGREKEETGTCSSFFNYKDHIIKHQKAYGMLALVIRQGGEGKAQNVTMWLGRQSG